MAEKPVHEAHRARLKQRFFQEGLLEFADHNALELLLFYAIPKGDTNPIAHALMERYGSFSAVFDAPYEDLLNVKGVGAHTASFLKLLPEFSRRYCTDRFACGKQLESREAIGDYLVSRFLGEENECVVGMFYDASNRLCDSCLLHRGSVNSASFSMRSLAELVVLKHARGVILAHNHPKGLPIASADDLETTRRVDRFLREIGARLYEHFIVAESRYVGIAPDLFPKLPKGEKSPAGRK